MSQTYTSAATSVNRSRLPAVYSRAPITKGDVVLDYGCGRYVDHIRKAVTSAGSVYLAYDKYNQSPETNSTSMDVVKRLTAIGTPVTVVCSNVLNVIDNETEIAYIAARILGIVRRTGGKAYITVYEGDRSGTGRQTGPDQYQRNSPLRDYLRFFAGATVHNGMIVVS